MKSDNIQKLLKLSLVYTYKIKVHAVTLDSFLIHLLLLQVYLLTLNLKPLLQLVM